jgi:incFII family plasmid replication initiator RepA
VDWPPSLFRQPVISRATRALKFLAELGLITYQTEYDPQIGCNIPTDITFTPALFSALDVSEVAVVAAPQPCEWENARKAKLKQLEMDELIAKAWRFVRERFRSYQAERNLTAGSGILHGGMHHGSVMTSRRACVSN